jgi:hypothetical protein
MENKVQGICVYSNGEMKIILNPALVEKDNSTSCFNISTSPLCVFLQETEEGINKTP